MLLHRFEDRGLDDAGADGVYANPGARVLSGRSPGETKDPGLAGAVGREPGEAEVRRRGGDVDDRATAVLQHRGDCVVHADKDAAQIDGYHVIENLRRAVGDRRNVAVDSGVVAEDVEPAVVADGRFDRCPNGRVVGDIAANSTQPVQAS